jgi:hypothetical protein
MNKKYIIVLSLALALPTTILAISFLIIKLINIGIISSELGILIIVIVIGSILFNIMKYAKKTKS